MTLGKNVTRKVEGKETEIDRVTSLEIMLCLLRLPIEFITAPIRLVGNVRVRM